METQSTNPFDKHNAPSQRDSTISLSRSPKQMALDNLIRRELRVSDPNDSAEIAKALLARYKNTPSAMGITQEATGLPLSVVDSMPATSMYAETSSDKELQQALDDVDLDLRELTTNHILKDVIPELEGWAGAVRSAIKEGTAAARFAIDPRQRDKTFAIRRTLGDYARLARLVGALTPELSVTYRKFAQSLDEVAAVLLVMMGEALANVGFNSGRYLLQVPFSELQIRRDAAIYALRNLVGATQYAYGPNEWPRGLDAYRKLFTMLEAQGQGDLRSLLVENELARIMDELIHRAANGRAEGLRVLGATAQLDLERLRRLTIVAQGLVQPESPPLTSFLEALRLFIDGFNPSGGFRLLRIARPPVLFYGLYGVSGLTEAENRLLQLVIQRGLLADRLDCFMECGCTATIVKCQILLDKILYDVDRAIDLYAMGTTDFGEPERRAAAYSYVIQAFLSNFVNNREELDSREETKLCELPDSLHNPKSTKNKQIGILDRIQSLLRPSKARDSLMEQELCIHRTAEARWETLVRTMAPSCVIYNDVFMAIDALIGDALDRVTSQQNYQCTSNEINLPPHYETSLDSIANDVSSQGEGRGDNTSDSTTEMTPSNPTITGGLG